MEDLNVKDIALSKVMNCRKYPSLDTHSSTRWPTMLTSDPITVGVSAEATGFLAAP